LSNQHPIDKCNNPIKCEFKIGDRVKTYMVGKFIIGTVKSFSIGHDPYLVLVLFDGKQGQFSTEQRWMTHSRLTKIIEKERVIFT